MNTDKAYLFGLIIGGGIWGSGEDILRIRLPYKQWGSFRQNPKRAASISQDIMRVVSPLFRNIYNIPIDFEATDWEWNILCHGDLSQLKFDLASYGINCVGELRNSASFGSVIADLVDDNLKRRFIAGLADTIASTAPTHRRFNDNVQILSFELKGFNFALICDLCRLLHSVNCFPDQIGWNHPNLQCTSNPYYRGWTKGTKLRVLLDQYAEFGAFAFKTKAKSSTDNRNLQNQKNKAVPCPERDIHVAASCVHPAEHDKRLPELIRGGHYLHNRHICAVLGCENAPYGKIKDSFNDIGKLIIPFPIICKASKMRIEEIIQNDPLLCNRKYCISNVKISTLYKEFQSDNNCLLYANKPECGYPISEVMQAIAFLVANDNELRGTRTKGGYVQIIERYLLSTPNVSVEMRVPDLLTPLVICRNNRAAMIGSRNPSVYKKIVTVSPDNEYKLCVRKITEADLRDAR